MWIGSVLECRLVGIRVSDDEILGEYNAFAEPRGLAFDGEFIWLIEYFDNHLLKFDGNGNFFTALPVGQGPTDVAFDGTSIWVSNSLGNTVTRLNATSGEFMSEISVGNRPQALTFDGQRIWVANNRVDTVSTIAP